LTDCNSQEQDPDWYDLVPKSFKKRPKRDYFRDLNRAKLVGLVAELKETVESVASAINKKKKAERTTEERHILSECYHCVEQVNAYVKPLEGMKGEYADYYDRNSPNRICTAEGKFKCELCSSHTSYPYRNAAQLRDFKGQWTGDHVIERNSRSNDRKKVLPALTDALTKLKTDQSINMDYFCALMLEYTCKGKPDANIVFIHRACHQLIIHDAAVDATKIYKNT